MRSRSQPEVSTPSITRDWARSRGGRPFPWRISRMAWNPHGGSWMKAPDEKGKGLLPRGDRLAIERTLLANERTFLAYFRTSVVFLTSGVAVLHLEFFAEIRQI